MSHESKVERLPKSRVVCTVSFAKEQQKAAEEAALARLSQQVNIKGFRVGHAPADLVRSRFPEERILEETVRQLMRDMLPNLVTEHAIQPVIPPKIEVKTKEPLTIAVTFVEKPKVTIKNIDKLSIAKKEVKIEPKEIQKVVDSVLSDYRIATDVERAAKTDDRITMNFSAKDHAGAPIEGLSAEGYQAIIGSKTLLPGFEDELHGLKKGESKSFTLTLPEKFPAEHLRGKKATFDVTVTRVEETKLPELTDAFVKEKLGSDSEAAFRTMVEQSMKSQEEQFHRMQRERELMEEIKKRTEADIAEELIEEEMRDLIDDWSQRLEKQGLTIQDALKKEGKTVEQVEKDLKAQADERWKLRLGMAHLIEHKGITVTDEEIEAAAASFVEGLPTEQRADAKNEIEKKGRLYDEIRWRALVEKVVTGLLA